MLLVANIYINGTQCLAIGDTGCSRMFVDTDRCWSLRRAVVDIMTIGGMSHSCCGVGMVIVATEGGNSAKISILEVRGKPLGYDLLLGIDAIRALGGVAVWPSGQIQIGGSLVPKCAAITINKPTSLLHSTSRAEPSLDCGMEVAWRSCTWRTGQWSIGVSGGSGDSRGLQAGASLVDKQWLAHPVPGRKAGASQRANSLDGHVTAKQIQSITSHRFPRAQPPRWCIYCQLRRLCNQAARMATEGLQYVSARPQESVPAGTRSGVTMAISDRENWLEEILSDMLGIWFECRSSYYEGHHQHSAGSGCNHWPSGNIFINEDVAPMTRVREHLAQFGLECKDLEWLESSIRVLELAVVKELGKLQWRQGSVVPNVPRVITWRTVFSLCWRLVGHLPVCDWLRVACRILKRRASSVTKGWDDKTRDALLQRMVSETVRSVQRYDPAHGDWYTEEQELNVWADANSLAIRVALEKHKSILEDACWLCPENDAWHITLAQLDAVLKGINLALQWQSRVLHIKTDSVCVYHWVSDNLTGRAWVRTKPASEMLIQWRLNNSQRPHKRVSPDHGRDLGSISPESSRLSNACSAAMVWRDEEG